MILFARTLPIIGGLTSLAALILLLIFPSNWLLFLLVGVFSIFYVTGSLAGWGGDLERWGHVVMTPAAFFISALTYLLLQESQIVMFVAAGLTALFLALFWEHVFRFVHLPGTYQPYSLEQTSLVLHFISVFFLAEVFYGLNTFLQVPIWLLTIVAAVVAGIFVYETLWMSKLRDKLSIRVAAIGALLFAELFWALSLLPTSFKVNAAVLAVLFYVFLGLVRASLLQRLTQEVLRRYVLIGGGLIFLLFVTAQWI